MHRRECFRPPQIATVCKIGRQKRSFQAIQRVAIDFLGEPDGGLKMFGEVLPCTGYRFLHPVEKSRLFLLLVGLVAAPKKASKHEI